MGASDAGTETPEDSSFSEGLKRYSRTSRWTQLSQYMAWLLITINRHLQRTHCFQLWEPTIDMAHVKDVPIYITKKASADRFSIFYRAEGPDQASRRARSQLQNGAVQRGIGAQPQQAKKTSGLTAGCPFFASVLTLALLATFSRLPSSSVSQIRLFFNRTKGRGTAGRILQEILNQVK